MSDEDVRIGVFVCDCGSNIAGVVDVPQVVAYAKGLPDVAFVDEGRWSCSVDALSDMQESIKEHHLNRADFGFHGCDALVSWEVVTRAAEIAQVCYAPQSPFGYSPHHMHEMGQKT